MANLERYWLIGNVSDFNSDSTSGWVEIDTNHTNLSNGWNSHGFADYSWNANSSGKLQSTYSDFNNDHATLYVWVRYWAEYGAGGKGFKNCSGTIKACDAFSGNASDWSYSGPTNSGTICWCNHYTSWTPLNFFGYSSLADPTITHTNASFDGYNLKGRLLGGQDFKAYIAAYIDYYPGCYVRYYHSTPNSATYSTGQYYKNDSISFPTKSSTGYRFEGWYSGSTVGAGTRVTSATAGVIDLQYHGEWTKLYKTIFYKSDGSILQTDIQRTLASGLNTVTAPPETPTRAGYVFKGWTNAISNQNYNSTQTLYGVNSTITLVDSMVNGSPTNDGFEIKFYGSWNPLYTITYKDGSTTLKTDTYAVEKDANYTVLNSSANVIVNNGVQSLYKNKEFLGWSTTNGATSATYITGSKINNVTADITLYAVWRVRDSVTLKENGTMLTSTTGTYGDFTLTGYAASENGVYYYNKNAYSSFIYVLNTGNTTGKRVYISSVSGITGGKTVDGRLWSASRTASSETAITINVTLVRNAEVTFYLCQKNINDYTPANFDSAFSITATPTPSSLSNKSGSGRDSDYKQYYISKQYYLNPTDSITFQSDCTDENLYISKFVVPKNVTTNMPNTWDPASTSIPDTCLEVSRIDAKNNKSKSPEVYPVIIDSDLSISQRSGKYQLIATEGSMGSDMTNYKQIKIYVVYEPFNTQFFITPKNYTAGKTVTEAYAMDDYVSMSNSTSSSSIRIFNDAPEDEYMGALLQNTTISKIDNKVISAVKINDVNIDFKEPPLLFRKNTSYKTAEDMEVNLFFPRPMGSGYGYDYPVEPVKCKYYLSPFSGYWVKCYKNSSYKPPCNIEVTWSDTDYKCFVILRLPEAGDDTNTTTTDTNPISDKLSFSGSDWDHYSDTDKNREIYIGELTNDLSTSKLNATLKDIVNSGYILKDIQKYSYDGTYNSELQGPTIITREDLDAAPEALPTGWTRTTSDTSNDVITIAQKAPAAGAVDYYFITYEEGLPIFYPDDEGAGKRAIQLYWEGTRAIGLYYENTRLL